MTRRQLVKNASIGAAAMACGARGQDSARPARQVKALVFDTFGTVVDWRGSIIEEGKAWEKTKGVTVDWGHFADWWRAGYAPSMDKVRKGEMPWTNLDHLHRALLEDLLPEFHIDGLSEAEKDHWNRVWHRLKPWPDSVAGLTRLKKQYTIAPLSNGNVALLSDMAKHAGLPWDLILSAELARHYKPDREAYLTAVSLLELRPEEVMMCAAHRGDLMSARSFGLATGFIHRPDEYGPSRRGDEAQPGDFDVVSADIADLASRLGA
ncbi:MAG TPA: haloacid dehalogenase type II [Bryobacteraceae bacterium]|nr:haloacid dehalogenase type II [Bryobacteraceae bacterium]